MKCVALQIRIHLLLLLATMKLSIIIPYYNGELWIGTCLDSLLRQDLSAEDYEIIVVDDGSTHSIELLMHYVEAHPQIHYLHQENKKHAAARNHGLTIAQGEYVFFCDCDDYVADNVLGRLCYMANEERADVLLFGHYCLQEGEEPASAKRNFDYRTRFESGMAYMSQPPHQFCGGIWQFLIRRGFMMEKDLQFDERMVNCEEYLFFLQMMLAAGTVVKVNVDVYYYVQHPTSWIHLEGRVYNCVAFIDCKVSFLQYLSQTRRRLAKESVASPLLLAAMQKAEAIKTLSVLSNTFLYLPVKDNAAMVRKLRDLGYYPISLRLSGFDWIRQVANVYPLWMALCIVYHLMPGKLRVKAVRMLEDIMHLPNRAR